MLTNLRIILLFDDLFAMNKYKDRDTNTKKNSEQV